MSENKEKYKVFNRDQMKYLAIFFMFWGHLVAWINLMNNPDKVDIAMYIQPVSLMIISSVSLFCPPVMFFFIADGYRYTRNVKKYALRLLIFACVTQPFDWLVFQKIYGWHTSNVIFTLFFGLLAITAWESKYKLWQRIVLVILCDLATVAINSDWLLLGVVFILILHIFREKPKTRLIVYSSLTFAYFLCNLFSLGKVPAGKLIPAVFVMIFSFMSAYFCMTIFYNGKKGKFPVFSKWFFYIFYPLHYLVIWVVHKTL